MDAYIEDIRQKYIGMSNHISSIEAKLSSEFASIYNSHNSSSNNSFDPRYLLNRFNLLSQNIALIKNQSEDVLSAKMLMTEQLQHQLGMFNYLVHVMNKLKISEGAVEDAHMQTAIECERLLAQWHETGRFANQASSNDVGSLEFHSQLLKLYYQPGGLPLEVSSAAGETNAEEGPKETQSRPISTRSDGFLPISESEFANVPDLVRRRATLEGVNKVYEFLWTRAIKQGGPQETKRIEFAKHDISVVGQTGDAKLHTLRYLKIIEILQTDSSVRLIKDSRLAAKIQKHKKKQIVQQ